MNDDREFGWDDEILDEGGSFEPLPEGNYDFTVSKVERSRSNDNTAKGGLPACNMAKVTFSVWGTDSSREITENFILHSKMEWKLSQLFLSVGMKKHGEPLRMNWTAIVGKTGKCKVAVKTFKKKDGSDGTGNEIKKFYAYDEDVKTVSAQPNTSRSTQYYPPLSETSNYYGRGQESSLTDNSGSRNTSGRASAGWTPGAF